MIKNLNIKIDSELYDDYKSFCEENTFNLSERIRQFISIDMKLNKLDKDSIKELKKLEDKS